MSPSVRRRLPWLIHNTVNRVTVPIARSRYGPFSLVRHVGRRSGRTYETPLILARTPAGFVAELTYGPNVDWYRNVMAAGGCTVIHHRTEYRITAIEPCETAAGRAAYPPPLRTVLRLLRRTHFRLLRNDGRADNSG